MVWMLFAGATFCVVKDRMDAAVDDDSDRQVLDLYPYAVLIILLFTR